MNYRLAVLTHGDARLVAGALTSFAEHVTPGPRSVVIHADGFTRRGPNPLGVLGSLDSGDVDVHTSITERQHGFCGATATLWQQAIHQPEADYVFWLEHDFRFRRPVDLTQMAAVLRENPDLAQMALLRQAVNDAEKAAGGLVESRPGEFKAEHSIVSAPAEGFTWGVDWLSHRSFFTTNPSLMRSGFMATHPFEGGQAECEGLYGLALLDLGYRFGFWGSGEEWVEHVGVRDGFGY